MDNIKFGKFIKQLRSENHMTQKQLAEKLFITDKAVSKWERGLSMPDISLLESIAQIFGVTVSELLQGERETGSESGDEPDTYSDKPSADPYTHTYPGEIQGAYHVDSVYRQHLSDLAQKEQEMSVRNQKLSKCLTILSFASIAVATVLLLLQIVYYYLHITKGIEYPFAYEDTIVNELFVFCTAFGLGYRLRKNKQWILFFIGFFIMLTVFNVVTVFTAGFESVKVDLSPGYSNCAIVKREDKTGKIVMCRPAYGIFCQEYEVITESSTRLQNTQWINQDVCLVTYAEDFGTVNGYAATYGDRSQSGISYYSVTNAVTGTWGSAGSNSDSVRFVSDLNGIKITYNGNDYTYFGSNIKQYGTTALILRGTHSDEFILALNEDCVVDSVSGIIENGGTVSLCKIGEDASPVTMFCETAKSDHLEQFNVVSLDAGEYEVYNGILYYSVDGETTLNAPAEINGDKLCENGVLIGADLTYFTVREEKGARIYFKSKDSDNWQNTFVQLQGYFEIGSMGFLDLNHIYMLAFSDFAMTDAFGSIKYTSNGGKTWSDRFYGIGENDYIHFKIDSQCLYTDENTAFLTMPSGTGEKSDLYMSTDGGKTFSLLTFSTAGAYDFYTIPKYEHGQLTIVNTMGSDADNTSLSKTFVSTDNGRTWAEK